jgi:hypothetical protein
LVYNTRGYGIEGLVNYSTLSTTITTDVITTGVTSSTTALHIKVDV